MTAADYSPEHLELFARAVKAPLIHDAVTWLGDQARADDLSHEQNLAAVLDQEV